MQERNHYNEPIIKGRFCFVLIVAKSGGGGVQRHLEEFKQRKKKADRANRLDTAMAIFEGRERL